MAKLKLMNKIFLAALAAGSLNLASADENKPCVAPSLDFSTHEATADVSKTLKMYEEFVNQNPGDAKGLKYYSKWAIEGIKSAENLTHGDKSKANSAIRHLEFCGENLARDN